MKTEKVTRWEPANTAMSNNGHGAVNYGEWCEVEAQRLGKGAYVHSEEKKHKGELKTFCCIQRDSKEKAE
jgi:hypothetical protein